MSRKRVEIKIVSSSKLRKLDADARARDRSAMASDRSMKMPSFLSGGRLVWHGRA